MSADTNTIKPKTLRLARMLADLGVGEAADRLGVSPTTIWKWENGKTTPDARYVARVAEVYDIDAGCLYRDIELPRSDAVTA